MIPNLKMYTAALSTDLGQMSFTVLRRLHVSIYRHAYLGKPSTSRVSQGPTHEAPGTSNSMAARHLQGRGGGRRACGVAPAWWSRRPAWRARRSPRALCFLSCAPAVRSSSFFFRSLLSLFSVLGPSTPPLPTMGLVRPLLL